MAVRNCCCSVGNLKLFTSRRTATVVPCGGSLAALGGSEGGVGGGGATGTPEHRTALDNPYSHGPPIVEMSFLRRGIAIFAGNTAQMATEIRGTLWVERHRWYTGMVYRAELPVPGVLEVQVEVEHHDTICSTYLKASGQHYAGAALALLDPSGGAPGSAWPQALSPERGLLGDCQ